jgi:hypothetical protein
MKKFVSTTKRLACITGLAALAAASFAVIGTTGVASADPGCGWANQTQSADAATIVTARHILQSNYCWSDSDTSDGANTVHVAYEVGWTSFGTEVTTEGDTIDKVGPSYIATGYAKAEVCGGPLSIGACLTFNTFMQFSLDPSGHVGLDVPEWNM